MANRLVIRVRKPPPDHGHKQWKSLRRNVSLVILSVILALFLEDKEHRHLETFILAQFSATRLVPPREFILCFGLLSASCVALHYLFQTTTTKTSAIEHDKEFAVAVYPMGVQIGSSSGPCRHAFIPRHQIIDFQVQEVLLAHRVYSSACLVYKKEDNSNDKFMMELFPELELRHVECRSLCQKLREILRQQQH